jgi:hypothetical protein
VNITEQEALKTVYVCGACKKEHFDKRFAESCCVCTRCGKEAGTCGPSYSRTCVACTIKEDRDSRQRDLGNARSAVKRTEVKLADERERLERAEREMIAFNEKHPPRGSKAAAQRSALAATTDSKDAIGGKR